MVQDCYHNYDDDSSVILREGISDWENISDEDYQVLKDNFWRLQHGTYQTDLRPVLIEQDSVPLAKRIINIKELIAQERERQEKEQADRKAKEAERTRKKLLKKAGDEQKLLEELKKKYPDSV